MKRETSGGSFFIYGRIIYYVSDHLFVRFAGRVSLGWVHGQCNLARQASSYARTPNDINSPQTISNRSACQLRLIPYASTPLVTPKKRPIIRARERGESH